MTREEALLKLLAVEPDTRSALIVCTGWRIEETEATLDSLVARGLVTYCTKNTRGIHGERLYFPANASCRAARRNAGLVPESAGASRAGVRDARGGQLRSERALELGRAWSAHPQGSGAEEGC